MVTRSHVPQFQRPDTGDAFASGARLIWVDIAKGFRNRSRRHRASTQRPYSRWGFNVDSSCYVRRQLDICVSYAVVLLPIRLISFSIGG